MQNRSLDGSEKCDEKEKKSHICVSSSGTGMEQEGANLKVKKNILFIAVSLLLVFFGTILMNDDFHE